MATRVKGKAFQLVMKLDMPTDLADLMKDLPQQIQKKAVRSGIRAAMRPVRTHMKGLALSLSKVNKGDKPSQSTGALARSLEIKYGSPRSRPTGFYGMVGANRRHIEVLTSRKSENKRGKHLQYALRKTRKSDYKSRRKLKATLKHMGPLEVKSLYRRRRRGGRPIKRVPSRYFHLVDKGFVHYRSGALVPGKQIIQRTYEATVDQAQKVFVDNVTTRIHQIFQKMKK